MFVQWLGNSYKAFYELPIMAHKAKEGSNLSVSLWHGTISNGLWICIARPDTSFRYLMGQVVYLFFKETTLQWFQFQFILSKSVEYDTQSV